LKQNSGETNGKEKSVSGGKKKKMQREKGRKSLLYSRRKDEWGKFLREGKIVPAQSD